MAAISVSPLISMSVKYLWEKSPTASFYFKRRVPLDLRQQVGKEYVQVCLHTRDLREAAKKIKELARKTDADWEYLRNPTRATTIEKAHSVLRDWGIDPGNPKESEGLTYFHDSIDDKMPDEVRHKHHEASEQKIFSRSEFYEDIAKHVSPELFVALQITQGTLEIRASDCLDLYRKMRPGGPQVLKTTGIPFAYLIDHLGDRDIRRYRRTDANNFVRHLLDTKKVKTTTVQRYLNTLRAAWNVCIKENELEDAKNPWHSVEIPKLGHDSQDRQPFTIPQYKTLYAAIGVPKDDLRAMLIILAETGARLGEIVGLGVDDIHLKGVSVPHVHLRHRPWRRLKNDESVRKVPLTPKALESLEIALKLCEGSKYLFPRYVDGKATKASNASATLNKYVRAQGINLTVHSLRHGMTDLLRHIRCPEPLRKAIQGWSKGDIADHYGAGYSMEAMMDELVKATGLLGA